MPNWSKTFKSSGLGFSVVALEKQPKNLNFQRFLTSKRPLGGYFQNNACTNFQKRCNWTRYSDFKLIKSISKFLVALLGFALGKQPKNLNSQRLFTSNGPFGGYFQWNTCTDFHKVCSWERYGGAKFIKRISKFFIWTPLLLLEKNHRKI